MKQVTREEFNESQTAEALGPEALFHFRGRSEIEFEGGPETKAEYEFKGQLIGRITISPAGDVKYWIAG